MFVTYNLAESGSLKAKNSIPIEVYVVNFDVFSIGTERFAFNEPASSRKHNSEGIKSRSSERERRNLI